MLYIKIEKHISQHVHKLLRYSECQSRHGRNSEVKRAYGLNWVSCSQLCHMWQTDAHQDSNPSFLSPEALNLTSSDQGSVQTSLKASHNPAFSNTICCSDWKAGTARIRRRTWSLRARGGVESLFLALPRPYAVRKSPLSARNSFAWHTLHSCGYFINSTSPWCHRTKGGENVSLCLHSAHEKSFQHEMISCWTYMEELEEWENGLKCKKIDVPLDWSSVESTKCWFAAWKWSVNSYSHSWMCHCPHEEIRFEKENYAWL